MTGVYSEDEALVRIDARQENRSLLRKDLHTILRSLDFIPRAGKKFQLKSD